MFKILMTYKNTEGLDELLGNKNFSINIHPKPDPDTFKKLIADCDGLLIRSEVKVTSDVISCARNLKLIARAGTGVDNVDVSAATQKGIAVMNVPGGNTIAAAEHTMALILSLARNIPQAYQSLKAHRWEREKFVGTELPGKILGLVGFGRIAREVAIRAKSFGMSVMTYDPFVSPDFGASMGVSVVDSLDKILSESDIVSLHLPLNENTRNLINKQKLSLMKEGAFIINAARGPIVNERDLAEVVASGRIKAAVDVFAKEPPEDWTLIDTDGGGVVVTPHLGASTEEAQVKIAREIAGCVIDFFEKGVIRNAVNLPALDAATFKVLNPYLTLAEKMGSFQSQILQAAAPVKIKISVSGGSLPDGADYFVTLAYLKGYLARVMDEPVTYVNALALAKSGGINIIEEKNPPSPRYGYASLVEVEVFPSKDDRRSHLVAGSVFSSGEESFIPRIVRVDDVSVDVSPSGCMLFLTNADRPGMIGKIGTLLGERGINIGGMTVARRRMMMTTGAASSSGEEAFTFINVDGCPDKATLESISAIDGIKDVKFVEL